MTTKNITEHYKKYGVIEGDKLLLETAKNNYQKGYDEAKKKADVVIDFYAETLKECNEEKAELIEKIKEKFKEDWFCSDYEADEIGRIIKILDTFKNQTQELASLGEGVAPLFLNSQNQARDKR